MDCTGLARTAEDLSSGGNFLITLPLRENHSNPQALVEIVRVNGCEKRGPLYLFVLTGTLPL